MTNRKEQPIYLQIRNITSNNNLQTTKHTFPVLISTTEFQIISILGFDNALGRMIFDALSVSQLWII